MSHGLWQSLWRVRVALQVRDARSTSTIKPSKHLYRGKMIPVVSVVRLSILIIASVIGGFFLHASLYPQFTVSQTFSPVMIYTSLSRSVLVTSWGGSANVDGGGISFNRTTTPVLPGVSSFGDYHTLLRPGFYNVNATMYNKTYGFHYCSIGNVTLPQYLQTAVMDFSC